MIRVDPAHPAPEALASAADVLRGGGLVAFPTETVYGLGGNALDVAAVRRIFAAKGRPAYNPLIVHLPDAEAARDLVTEWPGAAARLASHFWPGPLTLVLPRKPIVPDVVTAGLDTVAIRVPRHPVALALLRELRLPIAAPSANRFTRLSPTTASHVLSSLGDAVDLILDAGPAPVGIESTVVDLSGPTPRLLRPGTISRTALEGVVGPVRSAGDAPKGERDARPSPGMVRQHYSPRGALHVFEESERSSMVAHAERAARGGERVGALLRTPLSAELADVVVMPAEAAAYASRLYSALHELDDRGCTLILVDAVPDAPEWAGVRDRLARASHAGGESDVSSRDTSL